MFSHMFRSQVNGRSWPQCPGGCRSKRWLAKVPGSWVFFNGLVSGKIVSGKPMETGDFPTKGFPIDFPLNQSGFCVCFLFHDTEWIDLRLKKWSAVCVCTVNCLSLTWKCARRIGGKSRLREVARLLNGLLVASNIYDFPCLHDRDPTTTLSGGRNEFSAI